MAKKKPASKKPKSVKMPMPKMPPVKMPKKAPANMPMPKMPMSMDAYEELKGLLLKLVNRIEDFDARLKKVEEVAHVQVKGDELMKEFKKFWEGLKWPEIIPTPVYPTMPVYPAPSGPSPSSPTYPGWPSPSLPDWTVVCGTTTDPSLQAYC